MSRPALLGISGSLRRQSYNTAILRTLADAVADRAALTLFALNELPLYDQDLDDEGGSAAVDAFRSAIRAAGGLVIASPEYNHGVSGVLKNALDWASRPLGAVPIAGKPVLTLTSSISAMGGVRAQAQLNVTLEIAGARRLLRPQSIVPHAHQKVVDGRLQDPEILAFLVAGVDALISELRA